MSITLPESGGCIYTPDTVPAPTWWLALEEIKHRKLNLQVVAHMKQEKRDALREHGDRVQFDEIKNTSIGK